MKRKAVFSLLRFHHGVHLRFDFTEKLQYSSLKRNFFHSIQHYSTPSYSYDRSCPRHMFHPSRPFPHSLMACHHGFRNYHDQSSSSSKDHVWTKPQPITHDFIESLCNAAKESILSHVPSPPSTSTDQAKYVISTCPIQIFSQIMRIYGTYPLHRPQIDSFLTKSNYAVHFLDYISPHLKNLSVEQWVMLFSGVHRMVKLWKKALWQYNPHRSSTSSPSKITHSLEIDQTDANLSSLSLPSNPSSTGIYNTALSFHVSHSFWDATYDPFIRRSQLLNLSQIVRIFYIYGISEIEPSQYLAAKNLIQFFSRTTVNVVQQDRECSRPHNLVKLIFFLGKFEKNKFSKMYPEVVAQAAMVVPYALSSLELQVHLLSFFELSLALFSLSSFKANKIPASFLDAWFYACVEKLREVIQVPIHDNATRSAPLYALRGLVLLNLDSVPGDLGNNLNRFCERNIHVYQPRALTTIIHAFARLSIFPTDGFMVAWAKRVAEKLDSFNDNEISILIYSVGKIRHNAIKRSRADIKHDVLFTEMQQNLPAWCSKFPPDYLMGRLVTKCASIIHKLSTHGLHNVLQGLRAAGKNPGTSFLEHWYIASSKKMHNFTNQELINSFYSLSILKKVPPEWWTQDFQSLAIFRLPVFTTRDTVNLMMAFKNFNFGIMPSTELVNDWYQRMKLHLSKGQLNSDDVCGTLQIIHGLSSHTQVDPVFFNLWSNIAIGRLQKLRDSHLSLSWYLLSERRMNPSSSLIKSWSVALELKVFSFSTIALSNSILGFSRFGICPKDDFLSNWFARLESVQTLEGNRLSEVLMALGMLQVSKFRRPIVNLLLPILKRQASRMTLSKLALAVSALSALDIPIPSDILEACGQKIQNETPLQDKRLMKMLYYTLLFEAPYCKGIEKLFSNMNEKIGTNEFSASKAVLDISEDVINSLSVLFNRHKSTFKGGCWINVIGTYVHALSTELGLGTKSLHKMLAVKLIAAKEFNYRDGLLEQNGFLKHQIRILDKEGIQLVPVLKEAWDMQPSPNEKRLFLSDCINSLYGARRSSYVSQPSGSPSYSHDQSSCLTLEQFLAWRGDQHRNTRFWNKCD